MAVQLTYHGHSCFSMACGDYRIVLDPYGGHVPGYGPLELTADRVFCSHDHGDHAFVEGVTLTQSRPSPFRVTEWEVPHDDCGGALRGMNRIRMFEWDGLRLAHFGDLGCRPDLTAMPQIWELDVAMLPVGGFYTIDAAQADRLANDLNARIVIPMHYRLGELGFPQIDTLEQFTRLRTDVIRYPGNTFAVDKDTPGQTAILTYKPQ